MASERVEIPYEEVALAMYEFPNNSQKIEMDAWRFEILDGVNELIVDLRWSQLIRLFDGCCGDDMHELISQSKLLKNELEKLISESEVK